MKNFEDFTIEEQKALEKFRLFIEKKNDQLYTVSPVFLRESDKSGWTEYAKFYFQGLVRGWFSSNFDYESLADLIKFVESKDFFIKKPKSS